MILRLSSKNGMLCLLLSDRAASPVVAQKQTHCQQSLEQKMEIAVEQDAFDSKAVLQKRLQSMRDSAT
jgi:hypothetical protein